MKKKAPCMSAHLRNADCSPPQAQPAADVVFFLGKFINFLILKKTSGLLGFLGYWHIEAR
jgi:hypothetical protein